jgi:thioredoxin 1
MYRFRLSSRLGHRLFVPTFVLLLFLVLAGCGQAETPVAQSPIAQGSNLPRLVDLGADQCIPCKTMAPILEELKRDFAGKFVVEFIDVWKRREEAGRYGIQMIPTQIFYDESGKELFRRSGFIGKEDILATWKKLGYDFNK